MRRLELMKKLKPALKHKSIKLCNEAFNDMCEVIIQQLKEGNQVRLPHIGVFYVETVPTCSKRNPRTGELIEVPEHKKVKFKQVYELKQLINEE